MNEAIGNVCSIDVEDWFHILDSSAAPDFVQWERMDSRVERNLNQLLDMFAEAGVKGTFFWLGWIAERHPGLVRRCDEAGHELASHGYAHLLPYKVGPNLFREDLLKSKRLIEDIAGKEVLGFRAPGFGIKKGSKWAFDEIRAAGMKYDSSVFPSRRGHGGIADAPAEPFWIKTPSGPLLELPMPVVRILGLRMCLFGGGYLRIFPLTLIRWGIRQLQHQGRPLIVYLHPREIDPGQPRLPLGLLRRFKSYANVGSTKRKLHWILNNVELITLTELAERIESILPLPQ